MNSTYIGEKIKLFRKAAKLSQLELELRIDAASGSLSKIERGETNPTKETLTKIIEVLGVKPKDAAKFFGIHIEQDIANLVRASNSLNSLDINQVSKGFVNDIVKQLDMASAFVWLKEGDYLKTTPFTDAWYTQIITKLLPIPIAEIVVPLNDPKFKNNLNARAALDKKTYFTERFADISQPIFSLAISNTIEKIIRFKAHVLIPAVNGNNECIAVIVVSSYDPDDLKGKIPILEAFTKQITLTLENIEKYKSLETKLQQLKVN